MNKAEIFKFIEEKAEELGLTLKDLRGSCRRGEYSMARGVIAKVLRDEYSLTYEQIGEFLYKERSAITRAINKTTLALSMYHKISKEDKHDRPSGFWAKLFNVSK